MHALQPARCLWTAGVRNYSTGAFSVVHQCRSAVSRKEVGLGRVQCYAWNSRLQGQYAGFFLRCGLHFKFLLELTAYSSHLPRLAPASATT